MLIYIFRKTNYHNIEIVIRNSRCLQNLHNSSASGRKRFEILYLQNGIAFTCCAISFKAINRLQLKSSHSGGLNVKARGCLKSFLVCFQTTWDGSNRLWINYYFISLWYERNVFLLDKVHSTCKFRKIYLTFHMWNELTFLWNDLTIDWNDLTWNDLTM